MAKKKIAKKTPGFDFGANAEAPAAPAAATKSRGKDKGWARLEGERLMKANPAMTNKEVIAALEASPQRPEPLSPSLGNAISLWRKDLGLAPLRQRGAGVVNKVAKKKAAVARAGGEGLGVRVVGSYGDVIAAGKLLAGLGRDEAIKIIDALLQ